MNVNLKRRKIIRSGVATLLTGVAAGIYQARVFESKSAEQLKAKEISSTQHSATKSEKRPEYESAVRDNLVKTRDFDRFYSDDIFVAEDKMPVFQSVLKRILRVQKFIGYANFNLVSFDDMLLYASRYPSIGRFTPAELNFIDELFFHDAHEYGFYGEKVIENLTAKIKVNETIKIPGSGHYLFKDHALRKFHQLKKDIGNELVLTSGVRSVVKQIQLFLVKLDSSKGNLSMASRSLAPPGHSYHGIGDFDVGKKDFGEFNFTEKFSSTHEYKKLIELKYIDLRYTKENKFGVRYEPWHIKVV